MECLKMAPNVKKKKMSTYSRPREHHTQYIIQQQQDSPLTFLLIHQRVEIIHYKMKPLFHRYHTNKTMYKIIQPFFKKAV